MSNNVTPEIQSAELSSDGSANGVPVVSELYGKTGLTFPIQPKVLAEIRDAALAYKEGNPVWADTCNNLAKSAESFLGGYGPCEEYFKYSKPEVLAL